LNIRKYEIWRQARVAVRKACWYYFLPNSKRSVSIMSSYWHRRVSFHKPLVIVRSLAHNIYKFWIRIAFNGVYQRYNSFTMANLCEDSAWIWRTNMNIKYLTKLELNSRFCRKIKSKGRALNCCQGPDHGQDSANFRLVELFERLKRSQEYCLHF
jgi:hypothetical protein